ncbi:sortase domain-bontaining protein [Ilumatobacter sp.]|uniref:class F sortase n=1 Tax=Ilumatobacter sp. TaxID=1967498 RepID=UPI003B515FD0
MNEAESSDRAPGEPDAPRTADTNAATPRARTTLVVVVVLAAATAAIAVGAIRPETSGDGPVATSSRQTGAAGSGPSVVEDPAATVDGAPGTAAAIEPGPPATAGDVAGPVTDPGPTPTGVPTARRTGSGSSVAGPAGEASIANLLPPVARGSAIPDDIAPRPTPTRLRISSIDVSRYPIRGIGLDGDALEIPDETEIGWYRYGSTAGRAGAVVLAAHVSWNRTTGPFFRLETVDAGDEIEVTLDDGAVHRYTVTERAIYDKDELPRARIWRSSGPEELVLITCGGDYDPNRRRFGQNVVVYATPRG